MPYRIDLHRSSANALDRVVDLGPLDIEDGADGSLTALMPDDVPPERVARAADTSDFSVSEATSRDDGSVWLLRPRAMQAGRLRIVPATETDTDGPEAVRLLDTSAFGTGLHPTTALCLEEIDAATQANPPAALLDVGTGSGVLALAALRLGVPHATGIDVDAAALQTAAENARLNGLADRLTLLPGGPDAVSGTWPYVVANVLAAPLIEMAPALVRRVAHQGELLLSGIPSGVEPEVSRAYRRLGMRQLRVTARHGWVALVLQASW